MRQSDEWGKAMKEQGIRFGKAGHLAGTLTLAEPPGDLGLVLPSAGLLHRIGPHRMHVRLARLAAVRGISSIRFDMPGIGDSDASPLRSSYAEQELSSSMSAMDLLEQAAGSRRFVLAGLCSGADNACRTAVRDPRAVALFLMEPRFYPGPLSAPLRVVRRLREYGLRAGAARLWQQLREQRLRARRLEEQLGEQRLARDLRVLGQDSAQDGELAPAHDLAADLEALAARGVHLRLVYAGSSMGALDLRRHRRRVFAALAASPRFAVEALVQSDHLFTPATEMQAIEQRFQALLDAVAVGGVSPRNDGALPPSRLRAGLSRAAPG